MPLECELKYLDVDFVALNRRLNDVGGECGGRYFESNIVFDYPDRSLKAKGILLRLREKRGRAVLTVKCPPRIEETSELKVFEEIETAIGDFNVMTKALEVIGFYPAFAYEKIREKWKFAGCDICLDTLPFGEFVEIEGTEKTVPVCAQKLDLEGCSVSKETYHSMNIEYLRARGLEPNESFVFSAKERARIIRELAEE